MQAAINPTVSHSAVVDTFVKAALIQFRSVPVEAVDRGGGPSRRLFKNKLKKKSHVEQLIDNTNAYVMT